MADMQPMQCTSQLMEVSNAMVALHKEQFGRGPTRPRANFAGPDALMFVLEDALLPAERQLIDLGDAGRVRDARTAYQAATAEEFVAAVEGIVHRHVRAFASSVDPGTGECSRTSRSTRNPMPSWPRDAATGTRATARSGARRAVHRKPVADIRPVASGSTG